MCWRSPQPAILQISTGTQQTAVLKQILERVSAVPGVRAAGLTSVLPFTGGPATDFVIEGRAPVPDSQAPLADIRIVDADYFARWAFHCAPVELSLSATLPTRRASCSSMKRWRAVIGPAKILSVSA